MTYHQKKVELVSFVTQRIFDSYSYSPKKVKMVQLFLYVQSSEYFAHDFQSFSDAFKPLHFYSATANDFENHFEILWLSSS